VEPDHLIGERVYLLYKHIHPTRLVTEITQPHPLDLATDTNARETADDLRQSHLDLKFPRKPQIFHVTYSRRWPYRYSTSFALHRGAFARTLHAQTRNALPRSCTRFRQRRFAQPSQVSHKDCLSSRPSPFCVSSAKRSRVAGLPGGRANLHDC